MHDVSPGADLVPTPTPGAFPNCSRRNASTAPPPARAGRGVPHNGVLGGGSAFPGPRCDAQQTCGHCRAGGGGVVRPSSAPPSRRLAALPPPRGAAVEKRGVALSRLALRPMRGQGRAGQGWSCQPLNTPTKAEADRAAALTLLSSTKYRGRSRGGVRLEDFAVFAAPQRRREESRRLRPSAARPYFISSADADYLIFPDPNPGPSRAESADGSISHTGFGTPRARKREVWGGAGRGLIGAARAPRAPRAVALTRRRI